MPLETFLSTRIYEPLGMTDTLHHADPAKLDRMATVYRGGLAERRSSSPGARKISTALAVR